MNLSREGPPPSDAITSDARACATAHPPARLGKRPRQKGNPKKLGLISFTAAHTCEFQAITCDTHPRHANDDYAKAHGMPAALIQPFQLLALTSPGATLFTHYVGEKIDSFAGVSCQFVKDSDVGDTLYPALESEQTHTLRGGKKAESVTSLIDLVYKARQGPF